MTALALLGAGCAAPDSAGSQGNRLSTEQCNFFERDGRVTICHATGSMQNPIVVLRVSEQACINAHSGHDGDFIAPNGNCGPGACLPPTAPVDNIVPCCAGSSDVNGVCACNAGFTNCGGLCVLTDDHNACTVDACGASGGATHTPLTGTACDDNNLCTAGDTCTAGNCGGSPVATDDHNACTADSCSPSGGVSHTPLTGTACDDGNACTATDTCQSGTCQSGAPVVCPAATAPCRASVCDPGTGCSSVVVADGTACDDGNACTQTDTCQAGNCNGANPRTCEVPDQCHAAGTCNPSTGMCSAATALDGTACNDNNLCTSGDTCRTGTCLGAAVTCTAQDRCHAIGTCDPSTGTCSNPAAPDGTVCGATALGSSTCQTGTCTAPTDLIANGSFELGTFSPMSGPSWVNVSSGQTRITDWTVGCVSPTTSCTLNWHNSVLPSRAHDGDKVVDLNNGHRPGDLSDTGTLSQSFATTAGATYRLVFQLAGPYEGGVSGTVPRCVRITVAGATQDNCVATSSPGSMVWYRQEVLFTASATSTTLTFGSTNGYGYWGAFIDNVSVVRVN